MIHQNRLFIYNTVKNDRPKNKDTTHGNQAGASNRSRGIGNVPGTP
jgi:hypothetical protein